MNEQKMMKVVEVGGKVSAVLAYGGGIAACLLVNKLCKPLKVNPIIKYGGSYFLGYMIGDYAGKKAQELWNAGAAAKKANEELEAKMAELRESMNGEDPFGLAGMAADLFGSMPPHIQAAMRAQQSGADADGEKVMPFGFGQRQAAMRGEQPSPTPAETETNPADTSEE